MFMDKIGHNNSIYTNKYFKICKTIPYKKFPLMKGDYPYQLYCNC